MIMPFLRLVTIYVVVILAAVLFFKRDTVMPLLGLSGGDDQTETAAPAGATETATEAQAQAVSNPAATPTETIQEPVAETATSEQPPKYPTEETAQIVTTPTPETAETAPVADFQTRLDEARQAYWNRDMAGAEARYKELVTAAPDNADVKGELGNLYLAQRRLAEAADMYHQAGLQLIKDGNTQQIMSLINVLQNIAPDKATDLRSQLSQ